MKKGTGISLFLITISASSVLIGCFSDTASPGASGSTGNKNGATGNAVGGTDKAAIGGASGNASIGGKNAISSGVGGQPAVTTGNRGGAGAAAIGNVAVKLAPSVRNPKYKSEAPPMGEPLPTATPGTWTWIDINGALSRDGSPAGFYYKYSQTGNKNLLIYMVGGALCLDNFICSLNPANKEMSLTVENVIFGVPNFLGLSDPQDPNLPKWQSGIFKDDPTNPVKDWNMIFIPNVTGDLFLGSKPDGTLPDVEGTFQFVGHLNMLKFLGRIVPTFKDAPVVLLAGSSAGGIGSLGNAPVVLDSFIDQGNGARIFFLDDAGPLFDDPYLPVCLQKRARDAYGLSDSFPKECAGCFNADGGGMVRGLLEYIMDKYPDNLLGGLIDSDQDDIMKFFFSAAIDDCSYYELELASMLLYPPETYPAGLTNLLNDILNPARASSYIWSGIFHQNLFETESGDRFYEYNGLDKTVAEWLTTLLTGNAERIGVIQ